MDILKLFKYSQTESYTSGSTIFKKGDPANMLYIVLDGAVEICGEGNEIFETVSSGNIFGEMALIDDNPRSASAVAATECTLVKVDEKLFLYMVKKIPLFSLHIMRVITKRLRHMNEIRNA